jgi:tetratricopeptide (TPR) repeat protein
MSNIAKLKKKAAEHEAKKQYDKALEVYEQVLNTARSPDEERDVPLYNRVGDLHFRLGNSERAIGYYEQAADLYAEGGFFNNAIALCNKILRYAPNRTIVYYKLGIISAKKGFNSDAKQNFLEYADRMQRANKMDEAFRALKEFADLCPGQDDVRLMLAEQLARADRKSEALEQLELLYETLEAEGRTGEAAATLERMNTIDPTFKPKRSTTPRTQKKEGLVFLDLDFDAPMPIPVEAEAASPDIDKVAPSTSNDSAPVSDFPSYVPPDENVDLGATEVPDGYVLSQQPQAPDGLELTSLAEEDQPTHGSNELKFITPSDDEISTDMDIAPLDLSSANESGDEDEEDDSADDVSFTAPLQFIDTGEDIPEPIAHVTPVTPIRPITPLSELPPLETPFAAFDSNGSSNGSSDADFIDLGEWLERNRTPASTRMVAHDEEPENEEQKDFGEMLDKFKEGISRNVDEEDFESHYDLGIAFREMGLLDEAIGSFQKASRGSEQRVRASEAIGQCFMDKGEAGVAITVLERLVRDGSMGDSQLVGVLYLLGLAAESLSRESEAAAYYQRVLAVQIGFRDAASRLSSLTQASR